MRPILSTLMALVVVAALAACGSHSGSSDSSSASSASSGGSAASSDTASSAPAANGELPHYPGATTEASGASGAASGTVLSTADSFDKVYGWYQKNMPAGSEKSHMSTPVQAAVFMVGDVGKDQQSVSISVAGGKTMITIAHVSM